jgi:hypothetical protein
VHRIAIGGVAGVNQVSDQARPFDVPQESRAQANARA